MRPRTCFWDNCTNLTFRTIYWNGQDEPICGAHRPEAEEEIRDMLVYIDDHIS